MWWSRFAQPRLSPWTDDKPLRLLQHKSDRHDPEPKAIACYGLLRADTQGMLLRFVDRRPVSAVTTQFLGVGSQNAWLPKGKQRCCWCGTMPRGMSARPCGRGARRTTGASSGTAAVALWCVPCQSKSPWLNRIEPKWVHGKRAIAEPDRKLGVDELKHRICAYYDCELLDPIAQQVS